MILLKMLYYYLFPLREDPLIRAILEQRQPYFQALQANEKTRFARRVGYFLQFMRFSSPANLRLTAEMKILIAGAAIQLTFGLRRYLFRYYRKLMVMPGLYTLSGFQENFIGHVDKSNRSITLSWPGVQLGYEIRDDAHNVALHEMAHAILFENTLRLEFNEFFSRVNFDSWLLEAETQFLKNQNRPNILLSEYADKNLMEMFAVSIETFFEKPDMFKKHLPGLFNALVQLLKQDPGQAENPCNRVH